MFTIDKKLNLLKNSLLIIAICFLFFGAITNWPYVYYNILRYIVTLTSLFLIWFSYVVAPKERKIIFGILFALIAIVYNPIFPIHTTHIIWQTIDIIVGIIFFVLIIILNANKINLIKFKYF